MVIISSTTGSSSSRWYHRHRSSHRSAKPRQPSVRNASTIRIFIWSCHYCPATRTIEDSPPGLYKRFHHHVSLTQGDIHSDLANTTAPPRLIGMFPLRPHILPLEAKSRQVLLILNGKRMRVLSAHSMRACKFINSPVLIHSLPGR